MLQTRCLNLFPLLQHLYNDLTSSPCHLFPGLIVQWFSGPPFLTPRISWALTMLLPAYRLVGLAQCSQEKPWSFIRSSSTPYILTQLACAHHLSLSFRDPGIQLSLPETGPFHTSLQLLFPLPSALFSVALLKFKCQALLELILSLCPPIKWWITSSSAWLLMSESRSPSTTPGTGRMCI